MLSPMAGRDYDVAIVGSGFGGSVSALRLAEKGYRVAVLEQGRRITPADMDAGEADPRKLLWEPGLGLYGHFRQHIFRHVGIVSGVGVGGGSIVYAAVLLRPKTPFFQDPAWSQLDIDWQTALAPHYDTAERMLGRVQTPYKHSMDAYLERTASAMGAADTFGPTYNGIYFGEPGVERPDPFFDGAGPARTGCRLCARCLTGCPHGSKNSLDQNYLYLAEAQGATVLPLHHVTHITPTADGYRLDAVNLPAKRRAQPPVTARKVILAAGVIGTLELLFRARDEHGTLPNISPRLGSLARTNSEAIVGVLHDQVPEDFELGAAISSDFYPGDHTHITQNRFPPGYNFFRYYHGPLVDDPVPLRRTARTLGAMLRHPVRATRPWRTPDWHKRVTVLTVMQHLDNELRFHYSRSLLTPFRKRLRTATVPGKEAPTFLPLANEAARQLAHVNGGEPFNLLSESAGNLSSTAHILGGCPMGAGAADGVIDTSHEVHGHPGLYVVNGAAITANVGVNPSLTITALAERAMSLFPPKG